MSATGNEAVTLKQLKTLSDSMGGVNLMPIYMD